MATTLSTLGIGLMLISTIYCSTFGYNNSLTCNCEESCQDSGICSTGGCKQGWSGPTCQKENVALHKPANQSSYYKSYWPSSRGVDGDINTFIDMMASKQGWWLVDLLQNYPITDITLYHRNKLLHRLRGFYVYIINEDLVSTLCYHHTNETLTFVYKIRCNSTGRYVNITSDTNKAILNLSEVEIYVCSAGTYGANCTEFCHCSQYTRCDDITGYCKDGCLPRWHGNSCNKSCSDTNSYGDGCKFDCDKRKCNGTSDCDQVTGTCLYGCQDGWESQDCTRVCSQGNYGKSCQKLCSDRNCKSSDSTCDHVNGTCVGGCKAGWTSHDCTLVCSQGNYGKSCQKLCSDRNCKSSDSTCDHVNGTCVGGCKAGWTSHDCTLEL
ncbi:protein draper-like [Patella vulgata]|uniref:protein draper-like n=1 Tax=Patella vulgata TaxID=6465 RepID=UPI0024A7F200|nr:protein draper-like [Patella vulgata]